jgi:hypothetical protein
MINNAVFLLHFDEDYQFISLYTMLSTHLQAQHCYIGASAGTESHQLELDLGNSITTYKCAGWCSTTESLQSGIHIKVLPQHLTTQVNFQQRTNANAHFSAYK